MIEFVEVGRTIVGQRMALQPCPQIFDRIQVGRVGRQERHLDVAVGRVQILEDEFTVVRSQPVPDNQQRLLQVRAQRLEELDVLFFLDRAFVQSKQAVPARQAGNDRDVRPIEVELNDGRLPLRRPGAYSRGSFAQSRLVDENNQSSLAVRFFLSAGQVFRFQIWTASSSRSMAMLGEVRTCKEEVPLRVPITRIEENL